MSTHVPGYQSFFLFLHHFVLAISFTRHILGLKLIIKIFYLDLPDIDIGKISSAFVTLDEPFQHVSEVYLSISL